MELKSNIGNGLYYLSLKELSSREMNTDSDLKLHFRPKHNKDKFEAHFVIFLGKYEKSL